MADREDGHIQPVDLPERSELEQRLFYKATLNCALAAQNQSSSNAHDLEIAGARIRLVFAGDTLEKEFLPAVAHLKVREAPAQCDAVFHIWDSASSGVEMVEPPVGRVAFTDRGEIWGFSSSRYRSAFHWSEYSVCTLDMESGIGTYWVQSTDSLPYWAKSSPLRTLFHWFLEKRGMHLIHAAAIGSEDGGVLVTGKGGVGKSTTALTALAAGMKFVGDDYVLVALDPEPRVYALYSTAKLVPEQLELLPELREGAVHENESDEKAVIYLHPDRRGNLAPFLPLKWMVTPRFGDDAETRFEPISPVEIHRAAAFTTMSQLPHAGLATHEFIGRTVRRLAIARMVLGNDIRAVPKAIARLLNEGANVTQLSANSAKPLISVIIPVFNGASFLKEAVDSVLAQEYPSVEIIIVDDGSTDAIEEAVSALPVDVRFFRQENGGPSSARNRGVRDASADIIAFLDVDDLWPDGNLSLLVEMLDEGVDVVAGRGQLARMTGTSPGAHDFIGSPSETFANYIGAGVYRRSAFERVGLFDSELKFGEDEDWYRRAAELKLNVKRLDQVTLIVRRHENNMTRGKSTVELNVLRTFKKQLDRTRTYIAEADQQAVMAESCDGDDRSPDVA